MALWPGTLQGRGKAVEDRGTKLTAKWDHIGQRGCTIVSTERMVGADR